MSRLPRRLGIRGPALLAGLLITLPIFACGDSTSPPRVAELEVAVHSPHGAEGAVLLELVGAVDEVTAPGADTLVIRSGGDTTWVFAALRAPGSFGLTVRKPRQADRPRIRLLQVADGQNGLRPDLSGYEIEVTP